MNTPQNNHADSRPPRASLLAVAELLDQLERDLFVMRLGLAAMQGELRELLAGGEAN